jgi:hypothetical protein
MGRYLFAVHSNPVEGREDEYNEWYSNRHLPDLRTVAGVVSARRFTIADRQARLVSQQQYRYLSLYEVETDDPQGFIDELTSRIGTESMPRSDALSSDLSAILWKAL